MFKRMSVMILLALLFIGGIAFWKYKTIRAGMAMGAKFAPPPTAVTTVEVKAQTWQPVLSAVGSMKAVNGVMVSTDMAGIVAEVAFESGTPVKKGTMLVKLDTDEEAAQLASSQAKLALAKTDLERKRDLVTKKAIAQSDLDSAESMLKQMDAQVAEMKAVVARKQIVAPFDGMVGIRQVNVGQYLQPGSSIAPLQSMDPIYVEFALPQQHLLEIALGKKLRLTVAGEKFDGEVTAIDSRVDESTRNITIQGTVKNPANKLRPGMFVDVDVLLPETDGVLAIPSSSIAYAPYGDSVYVVKEATGADGKTGKEVEQRFVKLGSKRGDQVAVLTGVKAGDEIVSAGVFRLHAGSPVQVNNDVQPGNELHPKPEDS